MLNNIYQVENLDNTNLNNVQDMTTNSAFVFFHPRKNNIKVFYNITAWNILALTSAAKKKGKSVSPDIISFCMKWKNLLDNKDNMLNEKDNGKNSESHIIDIIKSEKRSYNVWGTILTDSPYDPALKDRQRQYLFILDRKCNNGNIKKNFRKWNLNRREIEIVQLLIADRSNKEIANDLDLSFNTIKGYMKLLMRKLDVNSRAGIVSKVLLG